MRDIASAMTSVCGTNHLLTQSWLCALSSVTSAALFLLSLIRMARPAGVYMPTFTTKWATRRSGIELICIGSQRTRECARRFSQGLFATLRWGRWISEDCSGAGLVTKVRMLLTLACLCHVITFAIEYAGTSMLSVHKEQWGT